MKKNANVTQVVILIMLLMLILSGCVSISTHEEVISERNTLADEMEKLKPEKEAFIDEVATLKSERDGLSDQVETLKKELDDIKNGPANLLSESKKAYEEENYAKVIELTSTLHNKFNGRSEDVEGQSLANDAQKEIDEKIRIKKEEEERIAAEALKSAQDKAREIIRVTKISKSAPNSAGGVDLFIGYRNMSEKVIKYATFTIVPYNKVGDVARSEIGGQSTFRAEDEGPHKKGEGIAGNYNWYWENAWYTWSIDRLELTEISITYMDGTSVRMSGEEVKYVQY